MKKEKPSKTAYEVALNILALGAKPEVAGILPSGIVNATEKLLISSGVASAKTVRSYRSRRMVRVYELFDWMMPGQFEGFASRKAFCERQVRQSIDAGARQVLVLGAGYDTMGWRLAPELPNVGFFEIDHPATASLKAKGIQEMGSRPNLHLMAEDLSGRQLSDVLSDNVDWHPSAQTAIVAEGLLPYLAPEAVRGLFAQCAAVTGDCRIAFTYISTRQDGRPDCGPRTRLVLWFLKVSGEPLLWSVRPDELGRFLESVGWTNAPELDGAIGKQGADLYAVATKVRRSHAEQGAEGEAANLSSFDRDLGQISRPGLDSVA